MVTGIFRCYNRGVYIKAQIRHPHEGALYPVVAPVAEKVECGGMLRFKVKLVSDDGAQTIDRFSHIGVTANDINICCGCNAA